MTLTALAVSMVVPVYVNDGHPSFKRKPKASAKVWRYMDLARYLSLLQTSSLHFARADQMSDSWEGSYSEGNLRMRAARFGPLNERRERQRPIVRQAMTQLMHMNCWHLNDAESAAIWR